MNKIEVDKKSLQFGLVIDGLISVFVLINILRDSHLSEAQSQIPTGLLLVPLTLLALLFTGIQFIRVVFALNLDVKEKLIYLLLLAVLALPSIDSWVSY